MPKVVFFDARPMKTLFTGWAVEADLPKLRLRYGQDVVCTPLIEIVPVPDVQPLQEAFQALEQGQYLLFTSRFAVQACEPWLHTLPSQVRVVSIGPATTSALMRAGIGPIEQVSKDNSFGVLEWFDAQPRGAVLLPRSDLGLPIIPEGLGNRGFRVSTVTAYMNRMPLHPKLVNIDEFDRFVFTSPSTVQRFVQLYGALPTGKEMLTRGPVTQLELDKYLNKY